MTTWRSAATAKAHIRYSLMPPTLSVEDAALDLRWRKAFGQGLPILGAADIVRMILTQHEGEEHASAERQTRRPGEGTAAR
jgi:hypothetical protein